MTSMWLTFSRVLLPMPAAVVSWVPLMAAVDPILRRHSDVPPPTDPDGILDYFFACVFALFLGGILQFCIGWPTTRKLQARGAQASDYFRMGGFVALGCLMFPLLAISSDLSNGVPLRSMEFFPYVIVTALLAVPIYFFYGVRGIIEHAANPELPQAHGRLSA